MMNIISKSREWKNPWMTILMVGFLCCAASLPKKNEPKNIDDSLVVGMLSLEAKNFASYEGVSVNGIQKKNVVVELIRQGDSLKVSTKSTADNGLFYFYNLKEGTYKISRFYYRVRYGESWADVWISPSPTAPVIVTPEKGKVLCLGNFSMSSDYKTSVRKVEITQVAGEIRKVFMSENPQSAWNGKDWIEKETTIIRNFKPQQ